MIRTNLEEQAALLEKRKAELGYRGFDFVAVNPGGRRTLEKQALLRCISESARERGEAPKFKANI